MSIAKHKTENRTRRTAIRLLAAVALVCATACDKEEKPAEQTYPVEISLTRSVIAGNDVTFGPGDTFLFVAHTGTETALGTAWYSGTYRYPEEGEIPTLRPCLMNFETNTVTTADSPTSGLYIGTTAVQIHFIYPARKSEGVGVISFDRNARTFLASTQQTVTAPSANSYFVTPWPAQTVLVEQISKLDIEVIQKNSDASVIVNSIKLLNAGDAKGMNNIHTHLTTLTYGVNHEVVIGSGEGTEGGWVKTENSGKDAVLYRTANPVRIHSCDYATAEKALTISVNITYVRDDSTEWDAQDVPIPLTFLKALPSTLYKVKLYTNPKAIYVTYAVVPFGEDVDEGGDIVTPEHTVGTFDFVSGIWTEGGNFDGDIRK